MDIISQKSVTCFCQQLFKIYCQMHAKLKQLLVFYHNTKIKLGSTIGSLCDKCIKSRTVQQDLVSIAWNTGMQPSQDHVLDSAILQFSVCT